MPSGKIYEVELSTTVYHTLYVRAANENEACTISKALIDSGELDIENSGDICFTDSSLFNTRVRDVSTEEANAPYIYDVTDIKKESV